MEQLIGILIAITTIQAFVIVRAVAAIKKLSKQLDSWRQLAIDSALKSKPVSVAKVREITDLPNS